MTAPRAGIIKAPERKSSFLESKELEREIDHSFDLTAEDMRRAEYGCNHLGTNPNYSIGVEDIYSLRNGIDLYDKKNKKTIAVEKFKSSIRCLERITPDKFAVIFHNENESSVVIYHVDDNLNLMKENSYQFPGMKILNTRYLSNDRYLFLLSNENKQGKRKACLQYVDARNKLFSTYYLNNIYPIPISRTGGYCHQGFHLFCSNKLVCVPLELGSKLTSRIVVLSKFKLFKELSKQMTTATEFKLDNQIVCIRQSWMLLDEQSILLLVSNFDSPYIDLCFPVLMFLTDHGKRKCNKLNLIQLTDKRVDRDKSFYPLENGDIVFNTHQPFRIELPHLKVFLNKVPDTIARKLALVLQKRDATFRFLIPIILSYLNDDVIVNRTQKERINRSLAGAQFRLYKNLPKITFKEEISKVDLELPTKQVWKP